jgi:tetratricopeptide (TPR) repeat protein
MMAVAALALLLFPVQEEAARKLLEEANDLQGQKKYGEALAKYEESIKIKPLNSALYNGGLAACLGGKPARAAQLWELLKKAEPDDPALLAKLVQVYQTTGEQARRDAARKEIFDLRAKGDEAARKKMVHYVRDQFTVGAHRVMVFEYFDLSGERALRYRFSVLNEKGGEAWFVSLGSYETTTQIAREQGEIGKDERMFHLDGYFDKGNSHKLYGMYKKEPSYEDCRKAVEDILTAEKK